MCVRLCVCVCVSVCLIGARGRQCTCACLHGTCVSVRVCYVCVVHLHEVVHAFMRVLMCVHVAGHKHTGAHVCAWGWP